MNIQFVKDTAELKGHNVEVTNRGFKVETEDFEIDFRTVDWTVAPKKLRIFVDGEESVDFEKAYQMSTERDSIMKGVDEETDKLFASLNRKVVKNKKQLVLDAIQEVDALRVVVGGASFGWWKTAGCSCPCSPGFIADVKNCKIKNVSRGHEFLDYIESISIVKK